MAKILDANGNPINTDMLRNPQSQRIETGYALHPLQNSVVRGLTPQRLHQILEGANRGELAAQAALGEEILEKDGHIQAEMSKRQRAAAKLKYTIAAPKNPNAAEKKLTAHVAEWFDSLPDIEDLFLCMLDALGHAYAAHEITWDTSGKLWLPTLTHRSATWFQSAPGGNTLRLRDGSQHGVELQHYGWMVHIHRAKPGALARAGLLRVLAWPFLFKNYALRDWAKLLEIYGIPMRIGKYSPSATKDEQAALLRAVTTLAQHGAGIMPDTMQIELLNAMANGKHDPYEALINWAERTCSKVILGGTLTSQADGKSSTNALGNVHNEVRHDLLESDGAQIASTINRQLIEPYVKLNIRAEGLRLPRLVFDTRKPADLQVFAESLPKLVQIGLQIPAAWAHEHLAIPQPEPGEAVLGIKPPASDTPPAATRRYIALKQSAAGELMPEDQALIDGMLELLPPDLVEDAGREMLASAVRAVREGEDEEDIQMRLLQAVPEMENSKMVVLLEKLIFIAGLVGHAYA